MLQDRSGDIILISSGFYYAGYGLMLLPPFKIIDSYGGYTSEYYNAFGLYLTGMIIPKFW